MRVVNKPQGFKGIAGFYLGMTVFVSVVFGVILYFILTEAPPNGTLAMAIILPVIFLTEGLMIWAVARFTEQDTP